MRHLMTIKNWTTVTRVIRETLYPFHKDSLRKRFPLSSQLHEFIRSFSSGYN